MVVEGLSYAKEKVTYCDPIYRSTLMIDPLRRSRRQRLISNLQCVSLHRHMRRTLSD